MSDTEAKIQGTTPSDKIQNTQPPQNGKVKSGLWVFLVCLTGYAALFFTFFVLFYLIVTVDRPNDVALATAVELLYSFLFALPLAIIAWLRIHVLRNARGRLKALSMSLMPVAFIAFILLPYIRDHLPNTLTSWQALPHPPVSLTRLVKTTPINALGGNLYGTTADGQIYSFSCEYSIDCAWKLTDELPPPPDPTSYWSGTCGFAGGMGALWLDPPAPRRVLDRLVTHYCGPDYSIETHFTLTDDGNVWSLQKWDGIYGFPAFICVAPISIMMAILGNKWEKASRERHLNAL